MGAGSTGVSPPPPGAAVVVVVVVVEVVLVVDVGGAVVVVDAGAAVVEVVLVVDAGAAVVDVVVGVPEGWEVVGAVDVVEKSRGSSADDPSILSKSSFIAPSISCNATTEGTAKRTATSAYSTSDAPLSLWSLPSILLTDPTLYDG